jgi:signal peptidase I
MMPKNTQTQGGRTQWSRMLIAAVVAAVASAGLLGQPVALLAKPANKTAAKPVAKPAKEADDDGDEKAAIKPPNGAFYAQTASMGPTIHSGETVGLDTTAYAKVDPVAGDIVVYTYTWSSTVQFAHRVIGVGGDTVQLKDGVVVLNGQPLVTKPEGTVKAGQKTLTQTREMLPNGRSYLVLADTPPVPEANTPVFKVPPGHYFVLADNRDNGSDSRRKDAGFLARSSIVGRLTMILQGSEGRRGTVLE